MALAADEFLPYTHVWIHRQMESRGRRPTVVLCRRRVEAGAFPFQPCVCSPPPLPILQAVKARFWRVFKYVKASPSRRNRREFLAAIREQRVELVHAHFATMGVLLEPICREVGIPQVVTFHGFDVTSALRRWPAYRTQVRRMLQRGVFVAAITKEMAALAVELGAREDRVFLSYLGVPTAEFPFADRSVRSGPVHFLHAGRLTAKKGVPDLVRAFAVAYPTAGTAILTIAGDGEEMASVRNAVRQQRPRCEVRLLGRVSDERLHELRQEADVFVANCRTDDAGTREGLPIAILEAASTGLPILSTWHAGIPEAVEDGICGRLVAERDHAALVGAFREMADQALRLRCGRAARLRMEQMFDLDRCNDVLWSVYESVVANGKPWLSEGGQ